MKTMKLGAKICRYFVIRSNSAQCKWVNIEMAFVGMNKMYIMLIMYKSYIFLNS